MNSNSLTETTNLPLATLDYITHTVHNSRERRLVTTGNTSNTCVYGY